MDIDSEAPEVAASSPTAQNVPGSFETTGSNGATTEETVPVPPPHKSQPSSPVAAAPPTPEEAEAFKAQGNKFYKAKDYRKAIEEYSKGWLCYLLVNATDANVLLLSSRRCRALVVHLSQ